MSTLLIIASTPRRGEALAAILEADDHYVLTTTTLHEAKGYLSIIKIHLIVRYAPRPRPPRWWSPPDPGKPWMTAPPLLLLGPPSGNCPPPPTAATAFLSHPCPPAVLRRLVSALLADPRVRSSQIQ